MNKLEQQKFKAFVESQEHPIFILVMGISGSGKTELSKQLSEQFGMEIISFENIRRELERNELFDVGYNEIVEMANGRIRKKLEQDKNVILESAGLNSYRRMQFLKTLKDIDCVKMCVIRLTDFETCLKNQENKKIETSEDVLWKQYENFQIVSPTEGWDYITKIIHNSGPSLEEILEIGRSNFVEVTQHLEIAGQMAIDRHYPAYLVNAAKYHDIGKFFSKQTDESEGDFPHHENIGAYLYALTSEDSNWIYVSNLILWHEVASKITSEKRQKLQKRFGQKFTNDLILLAALSKETTGEV